jgi:hypothetical protein
MLPKRIYSLAFFLALASCSRPDSSRLSGEAALLDPQAFRHIENLTSLNYRQALDDKTFDVSIDRIAGDIDALRAKERAMRQAFATKLADGSIFNTTLLLEGPSLDLRNAELAAIHAANAVLGDKPDDNSGFTELLSAFEQAGSIEDLGNRQLFRSFNENIYQILNLDPAARGPADSTVPLLAAMPYLKSRAETGQYVRGLRLKLEQLNQNFASYATQACGINPQTAIIPIKDNCPSAGVTPARKAERGVFQKKSMKIQGLIDILSDTGNLARAQAALLLPLSYPGIQDYLQKTVWSLQTIDERNPLHDEARIVRTALEDKLRASLKSEVIKEYASCQWSADCNPDILSRKFNRVNLDADALSRFLDAKRQQQSDANSQAYACLQSEQVQIELEKIPSKRTQLATSYNGLIGSAERDVKALLLEKEKKQAEMEAARFGSETQVVNFEEKVRSYNSQVDLAQNEFEQGLNSLSQAEASLQNRIDRTAKSMEALKKILDQYDLTQASSSASRILASLEAMKNELSSNISLAAEITSLIKSPLTAADRAAIENFCASTKASTAMGISFCGSKEKWFRDENLIADLKRFLNTVGSSPTELATMKEKCNAGINVESATHSSFCQAVETLEQYGKLQSLSFQAIENEGALLDLCRKNTPLGGPFCDAFKAYAVARRASVNLNGDPEAFCKELNRKKESLHEIRYCSIKTGKNTFAEDIAVVGSLINKIKSEDAGVQQQLQDQYQRDCKGQSTSAGNSYRLEACSLAAKSIELSYLRCRTIANGATNACVNPGTNIYADISVEIDAAYEGNKDSIQGIIAQVDELLKYTESTRHVVNRFVPKNTKYETRYPSLYELEMKVPIYVTEKNNRNLDVDGYRCAENNLEEPFDFERSPISGCRISNALLDQNIRHNVRPTALHCGMLYVPPTIACFNSETSKAKLREFKRRICTNINLTSPVFGHIIDSNICQPLSRAYEALLSIPQNQQIIGRKQLEGVLAYYTSLPQFGKELADNLTEASAILSRLSSNPSLSPATLDRLRANQGRINALIASNRVDSDKVISSLTETQSRANMETDKQLTMVKEELGLELANRTSQLDDIHTQFADASQTIVNSLKTANKSLDYSIKDTLNGLRAELSGIRAGLDSQIKNKQIEIDNFLFSNAINSISTENQLNMTKSESNELRTQLDNVDKQRAFLRDRTNLIQDSMADLVALVKRQANLFREQFLQQKKIMEIDLESLAIRSEGLTEQKTALDQAYVRDLDLLNDSRAKLEREKSYWQKLCSIKYDTGPTAEIVDSLSLKVVNDMESSLSQLLLQLGEALDLASAGGSNDNSSPGSDILASPADQWHYVKGIFSESQQTSSLKSKVDYYNAIRSKLATLIDTVAQDIYADYREWELQSLMIPLFPVAGSASLKVDPYLESYYLAFEQSFMRRSGAVRFAEIDSKLSQCFSEVATHEARSIDEEMSARLNCGADPEQQACLILGYSKFKLPSFAFIEAKDPGISQGAKFWHGSRLRGLSYIEDDKAELSLRIATLWAARKYYEGFRRNQKFTALYNQREAGQPVMDKSKKRHNLEFNLGLDLVVQAPSYYLVDGFLTALKHGNAQANLSLSYGVKIDSSAVLDTANAKGSSSVFLAQFKKDQYENSAVQVEKDPWILSFDAAAIHPGDYAFAWEGGSPFRKDLDAKYRAHKQSQQNYLGEVRGLPASAITLKFDLAQNRNRISYGDPFVTGLVLSLDIARPRSGFTSRSNLADLYLESEEGRLPLTAQGDLMLSDLFTSTDENFFPDESVLNWLINFKAELLADPAGLASCEWLQDNLVTGAN